MDVQDGDKSEQHTAETVVVYPLPLVITGDLIRAARALARMKQRHLADAAGLAIETIRRIEGFGSSPIDVYPSTLEKVTQALEAAGIEFLNDKQPGVRLRNP